MEWVFCVSITEVKAMQFEFVFPLPSLFPYKFVYL